MKCQAKTRSGKRCKRITKSKYCSTHQKRRKLRKNPVEIPDSEIEITTARSGGPGGQHVNKTSTKVNLAWNLTQSTLLSDEEKVLAVANLPNRFLRLVDDEYIVILSSQKTRSQLRNRDDAKEKLQEAVNQAIIPEKERKKRKTPKRIKEKRKEEKQKQSKKKQERRKKDWRRNIYDQDWSSETGILQMPTQILPDESAIDEDQLERVQRQAATAVDWNKIAKAASSEMPGMRWMYRRALSNAFSDPSVRSEFRNFLTALMARAERDLMAGF